MSVKDEELKEKVAVEIHAMTGSVPTMQRCHDIAERVLALIASVRVREQREAFCDGAVWVLGMVEWSGSVSLEKAKEAAACRFPEPEVQK